MPTNYEDIEKEKMPFEAVEVTSEQTNAQWYLLRLLDCEEQIEKMRNVIHTKDLEIQKLKGQNDEKDKTIKDWQEKYDDLLSKLESGAIGVAGAAVRAESRIVPLTPRIEPVEADTESALSPSPSPTVRRKKAVRIDDDVIARLKNDRKAYPVVCDQALRYWQMLADADLIDHRLKPTSRCGVTVMARIVSRMQTEVDPAISWAFFERYWDCDHLQSNLHREAYKHRKHYATVNRIFGLADDAPYLTKSSQAG